MPDLSKILNAKTPLTLAGLARGAQPLVMADLARAAKTRAVFVAADGAAMQAVADSAGFFAPELEVLTPYLIMVIVLLVRPQGLFARPEARRI